MQKFGSTYRLIEEAGLELAEKIDSLIEDDSPKGISLSMAHTIEGFAKVWDKYADQLDVLFVLGDRFEMFAAASATVSFNLKLAHLHGGETTLGAIDDKFRNAITALSSLHFTSTENHRRRIEEITASWNGVYNVGALGVESIKQSKMLSSSDFNQHFEFNIDEDYILTTYHPETVNLGENQQYIDELIAAFRLIPERVLCTLPNADTEGNIIRNALLTYEASAPDRIKCYENLGQIGYYTAMKNCRMMIGNTSSGIIEAATFNIPVLNIGGRQEGRDCSDNVIHVANKAAEILEAYNQALSMRSGDFMNVYEREDGLNQILEVLTSL